MVETAQTIQATQQIQKPAKSTSIKILQWLNLLLGFLLLFYLLRFGLGFYSGFAGFVNPIIDLTFTLLIPVPSLIFLLIGFVLLLYRKRLFKLALVLSIISTFWYIILGLLLLPISLKQ